MSQRNLFVEEIEAFGQSHVIERWEPTSPDEELDRIMQLARSDAENNTVDFDRAARCSVYRATILRELQQIVRRQAIALQQFRDSSQEQQSTRSVFAFGMADHEAGNSSWAADDF